MLEDAGGGWMTQSDKPLEAVDITAFLVPRRLDGDGFACSCRQGVAQGLVRSWTLAPPHTSPLRPTKRRGMQTWRPWR